MTNPPPPGWEPPHAGPQHPFGQQPQHEFGRTPVPPGWPQPPAPSTNNGLKWSLITVAILLVIAMSVGATLLFTRDSNADHTPNGADTAANGFASIRDSGPVRVITEDPSCAPSRPILDTLSKEESQGWHTRDPSIPASSWTATERATHEAVAAAMRRAADQSVALAKMTTNRVMRELYEQSIAYWRAYADSVPTYTPIDNELARVATASSSAIVAICAAVNNRSAAARSPLVKQAAPPSIPSEPLATENPAIFMDSEANSECDEWKDRLDQFDVDAASWFSLDANIPASEWTPEQRSSMEHIASVMSKYAEDLERIGKDSGDAIFDDFANLAGQYWRAFAEAIPSYTTDDSYLSSAASQAGFILYNACAYSDGK
ncbi:hypothetical protein FBY28_4549 [Arthrobacter sp. SLBN-53]|nr:hypothetical protein FBY28_4549 [Arthrobacter sp. SLBN-53]